LYWLSLDVENFRIELINEKVNTNLEGLVLTNTSLLDAVLANRTQLDAEAHNNDALIIDCDDQKKRVVNVAIGSLRSSLLRTIYSGALTDPTKAYEVMFKDIRKKAGVQDKLFQVEALRDTPTSGSAPQFFCATLKTSTCRHCYQADPTPLVIILNDVSGVCLCDGFWAARPPPQTFNPQFCPTVVANKFVASTPSFPLNQESALLPSLLTVYGLPFSEFAPDITTAMNKAVGRDAEQSFRSTWNYSLYFHRQYHNLSILSFRSCSSTLTRLPLIYDISLPVVLYHCAVFPNIHLPPWNFPTLGIGGSGGSATNVFSAGSSTSVLNRPSPTSSKLVETS